MCTQFIVNSLQARAGDRNHDDARIGGFVLSEDTNGSLTVGNDLGSGIDTACIDVGESELDEKFPRFQPDELFILFTFLDQQFHHLCYALSPIDEDPPFEVT